MYQIHHDLPLLVIDPSLMYTCASLSLSENDLSLSLPPSLSLAIAMSPDSISPLHLQLYEERP